MRVQCAVCTQVMDSLKDFVRHFEREHQIGRQSYHAGRLRPRKRGRIVSDVDAAHTWLEKKSHQFRCFACDALHDTIKSWQTCCSGRQGDFVSAQMLVPGLFEPLRVARMRKLVSEDRLKLNEKDDGGCFNSINEHANNHNKSGCADGHGDVTGSKRMSSNNADNDNDGFGKEIIASPQQDGNEDQVCGLHLSVHGSYANNPWKFGCDNRVNSRWRLSNDVVDGAAYPATTTQNVEDRWKIEENEPAQDQALGLENFHDHTSEKMMCAQSIWSVDEWLISRAVLDSSYTHGQSVDDGVALPPKKRIATQLSPDINLMASRDPRSRIYDDFQQTNDDCMVRKRKSQRVRKARRRAHMNLEPDPARIQLSNQWRIGLNSLDHNKMSIGDKIQSWVNTIPPSIGFKTPSPDKIIPPPPMVSFS